MKKKTQQKHSIILFGSIKWKSLVYNRINIGIIVAKSYLGKSLLYSTRFGHFVLMRIS